MNQDKCQLGNVVSDIIKAVLVGAAVAAVISLILFGVGMLAGSQGLLSALEMVKNGMLVLASVGMIIIAGMLIRSGKSEEKQVVHESWKNHFKVIGFKMVIGIFSLSFLFMAEGIDILLIKNFR